MSIEASLSDRLEQKLANHRANGLWRQRPLVTQPQSVTTQINGLTCLNFASNDYLGLANHPTIKHAAKVALSDHSLGSGAAHLISGHHLSHHLLEDELADWLGVEAALLFSTGYMANLAVQQTLAEKGDVIIADKLNHASLLDGARLSAAELQRYPHVDLNALEKRLQRARQAERQALVVTDGVFSMDGDLAPLAGIQALCQTYQAWLLVDDAHGFGVLGPEGRGSFAHFGLRPDDNTILVGTLGKAFGTAGAFVAGSKQLIDTLMQLARPYVFTTASSPIMAEATRAALSLVQTDEPRRQRLHDNINAFRTLASQANLPLMASSTPIQPILIGDNAPTMALAETLKSAGFWVGAIRPPTVPKGSARLRITLSADHSAEQIEQLVRALANAYQEQGLSHAR
ncbi:8-amino-7-oxononanoate synthase [Thiomicrospira sp. WB1]|uniref:8-amino-7-oxononanoate synthase n=1 Tax=Thiomicrospira sp. WB1 TaxID=1685380 RepID=UPI0007481709|nr:8-amino-7-oxononanoate synthase [Thiomicrospira sp. WB1]KUJ72623.1 8-amino-7-oxononanoate synthase [Thiomicrospira sp. WB1]